MTTISLASFGFLLTLFINIKREPAMERILPHQVLAAITLIFFVISIIIGFSIKINYDLYEISDYSRKTFFGFFDKLSGIPMIEKLLRIKDIKKEISKKLSIKNPIQIWFLIGQFATLSVGILLAVIYMWLYLFF
jgi:hypothetical protein